MPLRQIPTDRLDGLHDAGRGLSSAEAAQRRASFGFNDIVAPQSRAWRELLRETAHDPMIWYLLGTSLLFALLGDYPEALTLLVALLPLAGMDAYLHRRTQASTRGLASRLAARASVLRDGALVDLPARNLVPGDLVVVLPGQPFPADGLILAGAELQADESTLTGEAFPVRKQPCSAADGFPVAADTACWGFAGTRLLTGQASLRIAATAGDTLYGDIVRSVRGGQQGRTALQIQVGRLVGWMTIAAVALCLALAAIRLAQGHGIVDALLSAVTLAVAALPEEFPVVYTFFLAVAVYRLARRQALVRRAVAIENIGRITSICSDKTGTLTEGRLTLAHSEPAPGLAPERLIALSALAARRDSNDPLDLALLDADGVQATAERLATFPFTEDRRRETAVVRQADGSLLAVVKGAPETVLSGCGMDAAQDAAWREKAAAYGATGHKVIAAASRSLDASAWNGEEPGAGLAFAGLLAFEDELRPGVREAVAECRGAGIRVIMVTGDHPATAAAIARDIGLGGGSPLVVNAEEESAALAWQGADVIARALPAQKLALVRSLQAAGEIVAVTGDGVNDVPALQAADIGIAMGERGTQSAREVAAIVLLDDNFRTIVRAIAEGRQVFENLRMSFAYLLLIHIPLVLSAAIVPLSGEPLLYLPIHIVWLELIIHPTALLVFQELASSQRLKAVARSHRARFFGGGTTLAIGAAGLVLTLMLVVGYRYALADGGDVAHARAATLAILIVSGAAMTAALTGLRTAMARLVTLGGLVSLVLLVQIPVLAAAVNLRTLDFHDWALAGVAGVVSGAMAAGVGWLIRRPGPFHPQ